MAEGTHLKDCLEGQKKLEQTIMAEVLRREATDQKHDEIQQKQQEVQMEILKQFSQIQIRLDTIESRPNLEIPHPGVGEAFSSEFGSILGPPPFVKTPMNMHKEQMITIGLMEHNLEPGLLSVKDILDLCHKFYPNRE
ncbi:unnamed protein product [Cuscuta europaea]|uniref:Uncharacterized protein n=1 Tax=Cuscuta europaea TaxID=41803 RepID=A0A9P0YU93_CUSEU|nr:unnamed protein product [Cuscuta europaea]